MKSPRPAAAPPANPARRQLLFTLAAIAVAVALVWGLLALRAPPAPADDDNQRIAEEVVARFRGDLPRPFGPSLTVVQVELEGQALVVTIQSRRDAAQAHADPASLAEVRTGEQRELMLLCDNRDAVYLLARGMTLKRRFVDPNGVRFFEVELTPAMCLAARRGA
jgi:hypothetical protein